MHNNKWVPQVLKDVEKYCHENDLSEVALCLEEARRKFKRLQGEEKATLISDNKSVEPIRLVWSRQVDSIKCG